MDDDVYLVMEQLIRVLDLWDPKREEIYFGRSGKNWRKPLQVLVDLIIVKLKC